MVYVTAHPAMSAFDDVINDGVPKELITAQFIYELRNVQTNERQNADPTSRDGFNKAASQLEEKERRYMIQRPKRQSKILVMMR